jgi:hypothetical protein
MPRTRPLKTKEEIDKVPLERPVTVSLEPDGVVNLEDEQNPFEENQPLKTKTKPAQSEQVPDRQTGKTRPQNGATDPEDDVSDLRQQLEDMRRAKDEGDKRIAAEIRARQEAEKAVREREREASHSRVRAEDAEYDAILNAIDAAKSEAERAERDIAMASEAGDHKTVAEANRRLARAESRLAQLEDGKEAIESQKTVEAARLKAERENPRQQERQAPGSIDEYIDQLPNLMPSQRDWLREHPDALTNPRLNMRLQGAHVEAEDQGLRPGSQKYFDYLESRLGYTEQEDEETQVNRTPVSAPPSKAATNPSTGRPSTRQITLTPEQREIARLSGIDEITYAKQLQKLNAMKAEGTLN